MSQVHNSLIQTKLAVDRSLQQLAHIQSMFLFCEPRNMGLDAEIIESVIAMVGNVRKELRQSHNWLNMGIESQVEIQEAA